ncbi:penicillin-binding transpeptidase domain-containing protein [Desulfocurvus sp. DL9XJH121]
MVAKYAPRHVRNRDWAGIRLAAVAVLFGLAWIALWGRAFQVQVLKGDELSAMARRQHLASEFVSGERGRIMDRKGRVLAQSVECRSVFVRPAEIKDPAEAAVRLGRVLGLPSHDVARDLRSRRPFEWLARQVGDREAALVEGLDLPGVHLVDEYKRIYPNGSLAGQLLGFTGYDGEGLEGMERSMDKALAARTDRAVVQRDARGRTLYLDGATDEAAQSGQDVDLTIDADIQAVAEAALERAVTGNKAANGTCLVVDVASAEILAWAQYPFFNPNIYRQSGPGVWRNRIALDALEPGSTLKPFVVAAALQEGVIKPGNTYFCENGKWEVPGAVIRDTHKYGKLTVREIITLSSNIGAAKIGLDLGAERLYGYLSRLGLGRRPGLPLPGESRGILREADAWTQVDTANISFGQGVAVTPLQLAEAYLCLARGGVYTPLRILRDGTGPQQGAEVLHPDVCREVLSMLREVVEGEGTGRAARIEGLPVGGKTGTAQKASPSGGYGDEYLASFVALIPADKPQYLIQVMVDEPQPHHYGSVVAAPAVRDIAIQTLAQLGKLPEPSVEAARAIADGGQNNGNDDGHRVGMAAVDGLRPEIRKVGRTVPDVVGLSVRRAVEIFADAGTVPDFRGDGVVVRKQDPPSGRPWPQRGRACVLWLGDPPDRS